MPAGDYEVRVDTADIPAGFTLVAATPNDEPVTVGVGENVNDIDFGINDRGSIGDRLWVDANGDGIQDGGEGDLTTTLPDGPITVNLLQGGVVIDTVTTTDGTYLFDDLFAGDYTVEVDTATLPSGFNLTTPNNVAVDLAVGEDDDTVDFGANNQGVIGDLVFSDANGNGVRDAGEAGHRRRHRRAHAVGRRRAHPGRHHRWWRLHLPEPQCRHVHSLAVAQLDPYRRHDHVADTDRRIHHHPRRRARQSTPPISRSREPTRSVTRSGSTPTAKVTRTRPTACRASRVVLRDSGGGIVAMDVTDANGSYSFPFLLGGTYRVEVDDTTLPAGTELTTTSPVTGLAVTDGDTIDTADFGVTGTNSIGDRIWFDIDGDLVEDTGPAGTEPGVAGVTLAPARRRRRPRADRRSGPQPP